MIKDKTLMGLTVHWVIFEGVEVENDDVTVLEQRHVGCKKTRFDWTLSLD